jgi:hypothetical protein
MTRGKPTPIPLRARNDHQSTARRDLKTFYTIPVIALKSARISLMLFGPFRARRQLVVWL